MLPWTASDESITKEDLMKRLAAMSVFAMCMAFVGGTVSADMGKTAPALKTAADSPAESHNMQGIEHYNLGHWDVAKKHFMEAAKADPKSAESHYNLALVLDKAGDHKSATEHFKKAHELGKDNTEIQNSEILKGHLKMK
jgi:Tfp pilus assembly protein PilF